VGGLSPTSPLEADAAVDRSTAFLSATALAAVITLVVDQGTKLLAVAVLEGSTMRWGPLTLSVTRNDGGPFGVLPGSSALWATTTAAVLLALVLGGTRLHGSLLTATLLGLLVGGGVGNLLDRMVRSPGPGRGGVVDWISIEPYPKVFNAADVAIRGAALALVLTLAIGSRPARAARRERSPRRAGFPLHGDRPGSTRRVDRPVPRAGRARPARPRGRRRPRHRAG